MEEKCLDIGEKVTNIFSPFRKLILGVLFLALLCVTTLTVNNYYGQSDLAFMIILMVGCPMMALRIVDGKMTLKVSAIDILTLVWLLYSILNAISITTSQTKNSLIPLISAFVLYVLLRLTMPGVRFLGKVLVGVIAILGLYESALGLLQVYGFKQSNHAVFRITGTFFNPGPYSIYVVTVFSICLAYCVRRFGAYPIRSLFKGGGLMKMIGRWLFLMCAIGCLLGAMAMPATLSRTAFVSLAVVSLLLFGSRSRKTLMLIFLIALVFGGVLYFLKKDSADGRLLMWVISFKAMCRHLLFGNGIGGFHKAYSGSQAEFFMKNPDSSFISVVGSPEYAFNDFLEVGVEQGVIGMSLFILIIVTSVSVLLQRKDPIGFGLTALIVGAVFSYPFKLLPFRILGCVFVAYAATLDERCLLAIKGWSKIALPILSSAMALTLLVPVYTRIKSKVEAARDFEIDKILRMNTVNDVHIKRACVLSDNPRYLFWLGKRLAGVGRYGESLKVFRQGSEVSCDNIFYVMMGNLYASMGNNDQAENEYITAHYMQPCKLYPMYQLLLLYESEGRTGDAGKMAFAILDAKPKIRSSATDEMKTYASEFLRGNVK